MNGLALFFTLATAALMLGLPRKWAVLPLLMGAAYITFGQRLEIGSLSFPVIRVVIAAGFLRVILRGERPADGPNLVDRLMTVWAVWNICTASSFINRTSASFASGCYTILSGHTFC